MKKTQVDKLKNSSKLKDLVIIMNELLGKNGCPWDKEQNHKSLIKYLHEEAGEVEAAIKNSAWENLKEELGDIILQVVFHSALAEKKGHFNLEDVIKSINSKLIRRHPHVFGGKKFKTSAEVLVSWNKIKKDEKRKVTAKKGKK
ncbi:MAG: nucleotide pyrophosphohydrolase [Elusimicrobia bacterium]|nr:nucleotide pyrophosphohydrolase [Elusimicrobiota bacterium]